MEAATRNIAKARPHIQAREGRLEGSNLREKTEGATERRGYGPQREVRKECNHGKGAVMELVAVGKDL